MKLNFSANALFSSGVSKLTPRMTAFFSSYCLLWSRNPQPWAVQPGVSALG
ncbi:Hypothetical protein AA314_08848 [Archangium gephyra]|uniref:Uncharacterized protein n=1 Tax=Archangium gephyra TaxID=48 RepID=A0AAC8QG99_9BACT|nr:Hypothetical protein AA314_08848 [Archangium gephyra]